MSINLQVYVGPYLEVRNIDYELIEKYEAMIRDGRGESGSREEVRYVIPNVQMEGTSRQMTFDKYSETPVIELDDINQEMRAFGKLIAPFLIGLGKAGGSFGAKWGVVCGYF